jgi:hypothetical protein
MIFFPGGAVSGWWEGDRLRGFVEGDVGFADVISGAGCGESEAGFGMEGFESWG